ncbi:hypothetical protein [Methylobacterium aquaticum]|uniref:hypothetical protein n=1 Tax=Methylobacterium aquaticum TaxID=270351 RepID=UPI00193145AB|nr:hypothetical protein [Methylobacterium aquaticum]QRE74214.1 hypothetical protein F1D61_11890 [Methylobacterium aquaticum]
MSKSAHRAARKAVLHFQDQIEVLAKSDPARVIVFANAAISAARIVIERYDVESDALEAFEEFFAPVIVDEAAA